MIFGVSNESLHTICMQSTVISAPKSYVVATKLSEACDSVFGHHAITSKYFMKTK